MHAIGEFQFVRPLWLLMIPVLLATIYALAKSKRQRGWASYISADKIDHLIVSRPAAGRSATPVLMLAAVLACVALAGPSFDRLEGASGDRRAMIVLLDLSPSMLATDSAPSRIELAQLKLIDLLRTRADADTGLVVYAAGAHRVAPLTDDPGTIEALVPVLAPPIMPRAGSNPLAAVELALQMLDGAGVVHGELLLISDGVHADGVDAISAALGSRARLSVLAVGVEDKVPVPLADGGYLRDAGGAVALVELRHDRLRELADVNGGQFATLAADDSDLQVLSRRRTDWFPRGGAGIDQDYDRRVDVGYWLLLALVPIALLAFRRHQFWLLLAMVSLPLQSPAADWRQLLFSNDQLAAISLQNGDAATAAALFNDPQWAAVAHYNSGNYVEAVRLFGAADSADGLYNLGNALAMSGELESAARAYQQSLLLNADNPDAVFNLALVTTLLEDPSTSDNQRRQSAGSDDGDQPQQTQTSDPPPDQQQASDAQQQRVGGATGEGQSLAQQALQAGGQSGSRPGTASDEVAEQPAGDAQPVAAPPVNGDEVEGGQPANNPAGAIEDNDNRVLNPYSEQWLRELPQDPGGYMRRKFHYEAQMRPADEAPTEMHY